MIAIVMAITKIIGMTVPAMMMALLSFSPLFSFLSFSVIKTSKTNTQWLKVRLKCECKKSNCLKDVQESSDGNSFSMT